MEQFSQAKLDDIGAILECLPQKSIKLALKPYHYTPML